MSKALEQGKEAAPLPKPLFGSCWSCRILSGLALMGAGYWVYLGPRRLMKQGCPPSAWNIAQFTFATGLFCWGVVIIAHPAGRQKK